MYKRLRLGSGTAQMQKINEFVLEIFHYFATHKVFHKKEFFCFWGQMENGLKSVITEGKNCVSY